MNVIITINGKDYAITIQEAQKICREINEQLYPPSKDNDET